MNYEDDLKMETELSKLSWPEAPSIVTEEIPGPISKSVLDKEMLYETVTEILPNVLPCVWSEAFGATAKDPDGNMYIDLVASVAVNNVGHCHPRVVEVIRKECGTLMHNGGFPNQHRLKLGERLSKILPGKLNGTAKMTYGLSGSSALEIAVKFARKAAQRHYVATFEGAYHGAIGSTIDMGTNSSVRGIRGAYRSFSPFIYHLDPYAYCYRCPFNLQYPGCDLQCAKYVEYQLSNPRSGMDTEDIAALIIEPMQGEGGYVHPPEGFLKYIKKVCDKFGIFYIDDEVQAGMGRTGKFFAIEHHGVEPDLITLGKALGGDVPFSAVITRKEIAEKLEPASHVLTAAGNITSCAVACTNIDLLQNELMERSIKLGDYVIAQLKDMAKDVEIIGDVRGKGLAIGVELVRNRETKDPLPAQEMKRIILAFRDRGIFELPCGRYRNVIRISPPLIITRAHMDKFLGIMFDILKEVEDDILK